MICTEESVIQVLREARDLLKEEDRWIKSHWALDRNGSPTGTCSPDACQWCMSGAIFWAASKVSIMENINETELAERARREINMVLMQGQDIVSWNDHPMIKHADVMRVFNLVI